MNNPIVNVCILAFTLSRLHFYSMAVGCMESLVYYKRLLLRKHPACLLPGERESLINNCATILRELQDVDPERRQRYQELCKYFQGSWN